MTRRNCQGVAMVGEYLNKAMHQEIAEIDVFIEWMESVLDVYKSKSTALKRWPLGPSGAQGSNSGARSTPSKGGSGVAVGPLKNGICPLDLDASIPDVCAQSAEVVVPHTSPGSGGGHSSLEDRHRHSLVTFTALSRRVPPRSKRW